MRLVFVAGIAVLAACHREPDATRIRSAIEAMRSAAEERNPGDVLEHIAADFAGNRDAVDRDALERYLKLQLLSRDRIAIGVHRIDVRVDGDRATTTFEVTLRGNASRWMPAGGSTWDVTSGWRRDGSRWFCYTATWTEAAR